MKVLLESLPDHARIWIYPCKHTLTPEVEAQCLDKLNRFIEQWTAHNQVLKAAAHIFYHRFIVLAVDEHFNAASGCSIDASVAFMRELSETHQLDLFNRMRFYYQSDEGVIGVDKTELNLRFERGIIGESTLFFDNLIKTKGELRKDWLKPLGESWVRRMIRATVNRQITSDRSVDIIGSRSHPEP